MKIRINVKKTHILMYIKLLEVQKMEPNQKINCTVSSCKYNNQEKEKCTLEAIHVAPIEDTQTQTPDESMCASYEYEKE